MTLEIIPAMSIAGMDEEIAECARLALQAAPFDRTLLHQRAVALHRLGKPDAEVQKFWLRILRIDPDDDVARYYQQAAANGELGQCEPDYAYQVPDAEFRARFHQLAERVGGNLGEVRRHWREDGELRRLVRWAASSGDGRLKRIALTIVAAIDDAEAEFLDTLGKGLALLLGGRIEKNHEGNFRSRLDIGVGRHNVHLVGEEGFHVLFPDDLELEQAELRARQLALDGKGFLIPVIDGRLHGNQRLGCVEAVHHNPVNDKDLAHGLILHVVLMHLAHTEQAQLVIDLRTGGIGGL